MMFVITQLCVQFCPLGQTFTAPSGNHFSVYLPRWKARMAETRRPVFKAHNSREKKKGF